MTRRLAIILISGAILIVGLLWDLQLRPLLSFKNRFSVSVVAVEIEGKHLTVPPYSLVKPSNRSHTIVFHLANGEHVDCLYAAIDGKIHFTSVESAVYAPLGVGQNLWPNTQAADTH